MVALSDSALGCGRYGECDAKLTLSMACWSELRSRQVGAVVGPHLSYEVEFHLANDLALLTGWVDGLGQ